MRQQYFKKQIVFLIVLQAVTSPNRWLVLGNDKQCSKRTRSLALANVIKIKSLS